MNRPADRIDHSIERDVRALRASTARDMPAFFQTARELRAALLSRPLPARAGRRRGMAWLAAASAAAVVLGFVPFSYSTLAGHDVALTVHGSLTPPAREEVARALQAGIEGELVRVEAAPAATIFRTRVRGRSAREARDTANAFSAVLRGRGVESDVIISEWTALGSPSLYAFASDRIGRLLIEVRGRSAAEVERDIAARLAAIGFSDASVVVDHEGGHTSIDVRATDHQGRVHETETLRELIGPAAEAEPPVAIDMIDFSDLDAFPLEQRRDAIEHRLRERGIEATVVIEGGRLRIEAGVENGDHGEHGEHGERDRR